MGVERGQRGIPTQGGEPAVATFNVGLSALRVAAPLDVLPLALMPERSRVARVVAPGLAVNQVFGSTTSRAYEPRGVVSPCP